VPLVPEAHARLGRFVAGFAAAEPARVHLERAKRLLANEPNIRFACGAAAAADGDLPAALADWREAVRLSPGLVGPVFAAGRRAGLSADELLAAAVPGPEAALAAADAVAPPGSAERRRFLEIAAAAEPADGPAAAWEAVARARDELGRTEAADVAWRRATDAAAGRSDEAAVRERFARRLEADERYAEAIPVLEWLADRAPTDRGYRDRLDAARHAVELKRVIEGN
jgi:tetratricopeptide (TPR) repeat protein